MDYDDFDESDAMGYVDILGPSSADEDDLTYYLPQQINETWPLFCWGIVRQIWPNIWISLVLCLAWRICCVVLRRLVFPNPHLRYGILGLRTCESLLNGLSIIFGVTLLRHFFGDLCMKPCAFIFSIGLVLSSTALLSKKTPCVTPTASTSHGWTCEMISVTLCCLLLQLYCEFRMDPREWHMIRGTAMILIMKAISVAATGNNFHADRRGMGFLRHYLAWCGYAFSPGSVIFGPWFHFDDYLRALQFTGPSQDASLWKDLVRSTISFAVSTLCIIYSTYLSSIIDASYVFSFRWTNAYAQSQSFRFSHYFVSFFSQSLHQAIGFAALSFPKPDQRYLTALVTDPVSVELPRSLVDVVVNWNFPMHFWLKQYIYKPTRKFGQLPALLFTYAFSSLLHGLNFQLAAVLFSIGMYAYIDYVFREKLSSKFDACIGARDCRGKCNHRNKTNWWVRVVNVFFSCLAIFHLAYLAVMFDTSEQQEKGYNMFHVLDKWSNLNYLSHIVAALNYLLVLFIR
uniref:Protein-serine O-palmitoleoyltransferase porcupine n=2 Tax=Mesocestoides corti TaxID=53468 RepID=A0A5K3EY15_MESCO